MPDAPDELMTVPAAAKAANVPERSLFRAVEKGRIPNTKREGVTLVALPDVLAWAERRAAAKAGAAPATATAGSACHGGSGWQPVRPRGRTHSRRRTRGGGL